MSTTTTTTTVTSNNQLTTTWTEPPWSGWIETTGDALLILEAARRGLIPRVTRRLVDSERKMITSGSVFVFDEDESGIKRWTDGFFWSPSRILGNFLLYRETDKRGAAHRKLDSDANDSFHGDSGQLSRPRAEETHLGGVDKQREKILMGSLTNNPKFKPDGLMKKTFSLTIGGVAQHLISYYKIEDVQSGRLRSPSSLPELASLDISPEYLDKTHFRNPPKVEISADGRPIYRGEADDIDASPPLLPAPLSTGAPLADGRAAESSSANRRGGRRFDPLARRPRRPTRSGNGEPTTPTEPQPQQPLVPTPEYVDTNVTNPPAQYPAYYQAMPTQPHSPPPPHGYYPQQPPPQPSYPYGYPPTSNDPQQQVVQDAAQQQQVYYQYAAQAHPVPFATPWPAYYAPAHGHSFPAPAQHHYQPHRQSSIASAVPTANIEGDAPSGSSDEG